MSSIAELPVVLASKDLTPVTVEELRKRLSLTGVLHEEQRNELLARDIIWTAFSRYNRQKPSGSKNLNPEYLEEDVLVSTAHSLRDAREQLLSFFTGEPVKGSYALPRVYPYFCLEPHKLHPYDETRQSGWMTAGKSYVIPVDATDLIARQIWDELVQARILSMGPSQQTLTLQDMNPQLSEAIEKNYPGKELSLFSAESCVIGNLGTVAVVSFDGRYGQQFVGLCRPGDQRDIKVIY